MIDPNARSLYSTALAPPPGYALDAALATTYSLDLTTLAAIPIQLVLLSAGGASSTLEHDPLALLEALRRVTERLSVYCQAGRIQIPSVARPLFPLLEPVVREVSAPRGGAFHPKLWVLRFTRREADDPPQLRLLVLSRNITADRAWDLSLVLEGRPGKEAPRDSAQLAELIRALPRLTRASDSARDAQAEKLAGEVARTRWELPAGFGRVRFHVLGLNSQEWSLPRSERLAVVSPFCSSRALSRLAQSTGEPVVLVSRSEELARIEPSVLARFARVQVIAERAETEDGEEMAASGGVLRGLHAKAYLAECGPQIHLFVGSANATDAALVQGRNVEILAELVGKPPLVAGLDDRMGSDGMGAVLDDFDPPDNSQESEVDEEAERVLDNARCELARAGLLLELAGDGDEWELVLRTSSDVRLAGLSAARTWLITQPEARSVDAMPLALAHTVSFPPVALATATGFLAFELVAPRCAVPARFVLNVPLVGVPEGRTAAILRSSIGDPAAFLRYLLLLLSLESDTGDADGVPEELASCGRRNPAGGSDDLPLLEDLTRALNRDPGRLHSIRRLLRELDGPGHASVVPPEFRDLWRVFEAVLPEGE